MLKLHLNSKGFHRADFLLAGFLLFGLMLLTIPSRGAAWAGNDKNSIVFEDAFGRPISVDLPVQRIVVLNSDTLEVLRALGAQSRVKGVYSEIDRDEAFFKEFLDRPRVGSWRNANAELIADLTPDIVIAYEKNPGTELEKQLSSFGIQVIRLNFYKLGTIVKEVETLGRIIGREHQAHRLAAWYCKKLEAVQNRVGLVKKRPRVYVESYSDFHTAAPGSGGHDMCVYAGGKNLADKFKVPYSEVTSEWVIEEQPDVIFKTFAWSKGFKNKDNAFLNAVREKILTRPSWNLIQAVRKGRVHVFDSSIWTGPRAIIGVVYMAKWIYPDLFFDLDPKQIHKEYLESFQGLPYQGVYVSGDFSGGIQ